MSVSRKVIKKVYASEVSEGVNARVRRSIGSMALHHLSPFLLLDHATIKPGAGFDDHPHRGQTTVSYILKGKMEHEDSKGNRGILTPGDLQWMTAGRGIMHAEVPIFERGGDNPEALQLWIDLPKAKKGMKPAYQNQSASSLVTVHPNEQVDVTIISGESHGQSGPVKPDSECWYFDFKLKAPGATFFQELPEGWTAFVYLIEGEVLLGNSTEPHENHNTMVLSTTAGEKGIKITAASDSQFTRGVLIAGKPLNQEIYQHGPFIVSNRQEAIQAIKDFDMGRNGFEGAKQWKSSIGKKIYE